MPTTFHFSRVNFDYAIEQLEALVQDANLSELELHEASRIQITAGSQGSRGETSSYPLFCALAKAGGITEVSVLIDDDGTRTIRFRHCAFTLTHRLRVESRTLNLETGEVVTKWRS